MEDIARKIMFGWKPGMGIASARANRPNKADDPYGVREVPRTGERDSDRRDRMEKTFPTLNDARAYLYRRIMTDKGSQKTWMIYRFKGDYGTQTGQMYSTNINKYHAVEIGRRWALYENLNVPFSRAGIWYVNKDGTLGKKR